MERFDRGLRISAATFGCGYGIALVAFAVAGEHNHLHTSALTGQRFHTEREDVTVSSVTPRCCRRTGPELWQFVLATLPFAIAEGFGPSVAPVQARLAPRGLGAEFFAISTGMLAAFQIVTPCKHQLPPCLRPLLTCLLRCSLHTPPFPLALGCVALAS